jgi:hypothetical protein
MGIFNWLINIHVLDLTSLNQRFLWNHFHGLCFLHNIVVIHECVYINTIISTFRKMGCIKMCKIRQN